MPYLRICLLVKLRRNMESAGRGVHDLIRRCNNSLQEYEDKLHLVSRFMKIRTKIKEIDSLAEDAELSRRELAEGIRRISGQILEEL